MQVQDQPATVVGQDRLGDHLRALRHLPDDGVVVLGGAEDVAAQSSTRQRGRLGAAALALGGEVQVEERAVGEPGRLAELDLGQDVVEVLAGREVLDAQRRPVAAPVADLVGEQAAVAADVVPGQRRGAVGREAVGVEQQPSAGDQVPEGVGDEPLVLLQAAVVAADR